MKFLVLALCVCAASAASFGFKPTHPYQAAKAFVQISEPNSVVAAVYTAPKTAYETAKVVATAPVVAAKTLYAIGKEAEAGILRSQSEVNVDGFSYSYETNNGISSQASGILKNVDNKQVIVSQGSYEYTAPDGTRVELSYIADENGYQPRSDLLPVAPPVPEAILRSLEYIRSHAPTSGSEY